RGPCAPIRRLAVRRHPRGGAQPWGVAASVLQQRVRADPVEPRKRALARDVERLAPLERDPEQVAHQPFRDLRARPAPQEAQQGGRMAVVDQPERLGLGQRSADHLCVREITHLLSFSDCGVWVAGRALLVRYGIRGGRSESVHPVLWGRLCKFERVQAATASDECWILAVLWGVNWLPPHACSSDRSHWDRWAAARQVLAACSIPSPGNANL